MNNVYVYFENGTVKGIDHVTRARTYNGFLLVSTNERGMDIQYTFNLDRILYFESRNSVKKSYKERGKGEENAS